jgi:hypothetical protein
MSNRRKRGPEEEADLVGVEFQDAMSDDEVSLAQLDQFLVPGADDKGRSHTIALNVPPMLARQADIILASKRFPYASQKDMVRHGFVRHMGWLSNEIRKSIPSHHLAMFESISELVRDDDYHMKMEGVFLNLDERVGQHVTRGEHGEVLRLISHIDQGIRRMPPSLWVTRFSQRFYERYGTILRGKFKAEVTG